MASADYVRYWVSRRGEVHATLDHWNHMRNHPRLFGFTKREADGWAPADRDKTIGKALSRGWIRVRGRRPHMAFEFAILDRRTSAAIRRFLIVTRTDPGEKSLFDEVPTGRNWYQPNSWALGDNVCAARQKQRDAVESDCHGKSIR